MCAQYNLVKYNRRDGDSQSERLGGFINANPSVIVLESVIFKFNFLEMTLVKFIDTQFKSHKNVLLEEWLLNPPPNYR